MRRLSSGFRLPHAAEPERRAPNQRLRARIVELAAQNDNGREASAAAGELSICLLRMRSCAVEGATPANQPQSRGDPEAERAEAASRLGERLEEAMAYGNAWRANVAAARSEVAAVDEAEETSVLSRAQVLLDTGISVMATANQVATLGEALAN